MLIMIIHANAISQQKDQALIETTCKNTPNYKLCISVLRRSPGSATADVRGLALIMVGAVKDKTKQAISAVNNLIKSRRYPDLAEGLQKCNEVYKTVVKYDVAEAVEALTKGDPKFAENGMADAALEADTCESSTGGLDKSPLEAVNRPVFDLANVARAIIRNLL
ncbi:hypothetical protein BUALT_Bualt12G0109700 [Buddleja alternifolia]|uniref:Pectinesterase inhibitor domain-containing protein n=1 Tax=Buddleja alternifolia TaxID=168488 RepID=A0AAV6WRW7_9LAMI|nr:hypothetical protein BUALT_Bualt12G0109700 [Buddleja alternifolia]